MKRLSTAAALIVTFVTAPAYAQDPKFRVYAGAAYFPSSTTFDQTVTYAEFQEQTTVNAAEGADYLARAAHYATQRAIDPFTFPCLFARRAKAYRQTYKVNDEDMARVVVSCSPDQLAPLQALAREHGVPVEVAGRVGRADGPLEIHLRNTHVTYGWPVPALRRTYVDALPRRMRAEADGDA